MKGGRGEIEIDFDAELPDRGSSRRLVIENRHESRLSAYQVNCLIPRDPDVRITAQKRNYTQSFDELDYFRQFGLNFFRRCVPGTRHVWLTPLALLVPGRLFLARRT